MLPESTARRVSAKIMQALCISPRDADNAENHYDTALTRAVIAASDADSDFHDTFSSHYSSDYNAPSRLRGDINR